MQNLFPPDFRRSLAGNDATDARMQTASSIPAGIDERSLLDAQWYIITKTLDRMLGKTELYDKLVKELARALNQDPQRAAGKEESGEEFPLPGMVYRSPVMHEMAKRIYKTRNSKLPVLITGEPGTGKEGIARAIHLLSERHIGPFIAFNCTIVTK